MDDISEKKAKEILTGIVGLACRLANADPREFRVKDGGQQRTNRVKIDLYASVQNANAKINSAAARSGRLVRRSFMIWQKDDSSPVLLRILEWSFQVDLDQDYREIWSKQADHPGAKKEMAHMMAESIKELAQRTAA